MEDMFNATIICDKCGKKAQNIEIIKDGFRLRIKQCPGCGRKWYHPLDLEEYKNFSKLREKNFEVKLRFVGNSFCVSIPREIISFQEDMMNEMKEKMNQMIRMNLDSPEKLTLYFSKRIKKRQMESDENGR